MVSSSAPEKAFGPEAIRGALADAADAVDPEAGSEAWAVLL